MIRYFLYLVLFFLLSPCFAELVPPLSNPPTKEPWHLHLSPYFWFAGLSGHVNIRGNRVAFDNDFGDIRHDLDFSLGAHFEASRGPLSLLLDPDYVKITQKPAIRTDGSKTTYETTITDIGLFYRLYFIGFSKAYLKQASLELLGAGRIGTFHTVIDSHEVTTPASISDTSSFVVPIIGARFKYHFNPQWQLWLGGDFGGFQVTHVSSTWSGILGVDYKLSDFFDISLAYKVLSVNYSINNITINTFLQGPVLGCGFSW